MARHHVSWAGRTAEACGVVLEPSREAQEAVLVLLSLEHTYSPGGLQDFADSEFAPRLTKLLRTLERGPQGSQPIYYLACVPKQSAFSQAELALAMTALGWPAGTIVLLPAERHEIADAFLKGIDRLRWLFAGLLEVLVLNLEPSVVRTLLLQEEPAPDRARVRRLVNPEDDPWKMVDDSRVGFSRSRLAVPRPTRATRLPRYPVVFCHGMLACSMLKMRLPEDLNYFHPLRDFLRQRGFRVLSPQVPPTSGVVERAALLREKILAWTDEPVNIIAHSMGGLDARYLITHLGMADRVRSLTTVSAPHRGSYMADWFLANFRNRVPLLLALEAFGINVDGFRDCRPAVCREFNARTPDMPQVRYFSFGGDIQSSRVTPILRRAWNLMTPLEGPNDGLVSVASARWGEYLGTIHADHFAQTPDGLFVRQGEDFDSLSFFSRLVEDLARRGF